MAYDNDQWVYQASFKHGADMVNIRAGDIDSFESALVAFEERGIGLVLSIQKHMAAADVVASVMPVAGSAPVAASTPVETNGTWNQPSTTSQSVSKPTCQHGPRVGREGNGAKGPWRAYFCSTPKGTPDQCDPMWVDRKDSNAWNSWVAG